MVFIIILIAFLFIAALSKSHPSDYHERGPGLIPPNGDGSRWLQQHLKERWNLTEEEIDVLWKLQPKHRAEFLRSKRNRSAF